MTRHILILGNNLSALVTAYRLLHYGFSISIIDILPDKQTIAPPCATRESCNLAPQTLTLSNSQSIPLILHGFYHATWSLLQELSFEWPRPASQSVSLEFGNDGKTPIALPKPSRFTWGHPLTRLTLFKGLPWSDRWHLINFLERQWEENHLARHNPDIDNAETWLITAKQSEHSRTHFWNPLCRFLLHCNLSKASLGAFTEILSQYWFGRPTDAITFLPTLETLGKLETDLRHWLINKGVQLHSSQTRLHLVTNTEGIQGVELENQYVTAHAYVSALGPQRLLSLLPERDLARDADLSSLTHIEERTGLAVRLTLQDICMPPRLILNVGPFDWLTCQSRTDTDSRITVITCVTLENLLSKEYTEESLLHTTWTLIQSLFGFSKTSTQESCEPHIIREAGAFFPCYRGSRIHRPMPQTSVGNLFLTGPWTATNLPTSPESTIKSANACAEGVASAFYGTYD